jgi:hypothetical protein
MARIDALEANRQGCRRRFGSQFLIGGVDEVSERIGTCSTSVSSM